MALHGALYAWLRPNNERWQRNALRAMETRFKFPLATL